MTKAKVRVEDIVSVKKLIEELGLGKINASFTFIPEEVEVEVRVDEEKEGGR